MKATDPNYSRLMQEVELIWPNDKVMKKHFEKNTTQVIPLYDDYFITMEKKGIETRFCFGYSTCGQGPEYDDCQETYRNVNKDLAAYFMDYNKKHAPYDEWLKDLNDPTKDLYCWVHFMSGKNLLNWTTATQYEAEKKIRLISGKAFRISNSYKETIKKAVEAEKAAFEKRLDEYIKRYGTSKLRTWTYWIDE